MSKVLVVGANSTIARAILPLLKERHDVITAGRRDCDIYCDVTKEVPVPEGVDVIVNFAASFSEKTDEEVERAVKTNELGILHVCESAWRAKVRQVVHISSIFALQAPGDPSFSFYSLTKRHGDELAEEYAARHDLSLAILRPSRIYGDDRSFARGQPFLYQLIDVAAQGEDIELFGTRDARRNYIHVTDLGEILVRVIDRCVTGVYACVCPRDVTLSEIASVSQSVYGAGGAQRFRHDKPDIPDDKHVSDTSLYEKIEYRPVIDIQTGIERIVRHLGKERAS